MAETEQEQQPQAQEQVKAPAAPPKQKEVIGKDSFLKFLIRHGGFTGRPSSFSSTWRSNDFCYYLLFSDNFPRSKYDISRVQLGVFLNGILFRFCLVDLALCSRIFLFNERHLRPIVTPFFNSFIYGH